MVVSRNDVGDPDAQKFDQFLMRLETTKQPPPHPVSESRQHADSSDSSTFDSRTETAFDDRTIEPSDRHLFETRQCLVERRVVGSPRSAHSSVDSFIARTQSGQSSMERFGTSEQELQLVNRNSETRLFEDGLPDAILKLDRRNDIPTPRHKNDVLLEIEACTVDKRDLMVRPGVRCTESLQQGVETTGVDCIGRVVQLTTHARAVYGISIDDRVAAIYPFEYKDGYKDKGRRNNRYALVDAGFVVAVPKHVDAAEAACMIRLYLSAFQSISMGISGFRNRYGFDQLRGQSILIQNGQTELGRALIDLAALLGATQIFATGPTEYHSVLTKLGAIPLGAETFGWELFLEEKLSLVLVQKMPTADNFEQFVSLLDENKGNIVYIHQGHKHDGDDLGTIADDVSCDGRHLTDLAKKARAALSSAKFSLRLACSPKYMCYEGVWPSCKESPSQFKEDLRYLFTLLGQGGLKPDVDECINLEEVAEAQDRIELLGKRGTIVCLPKSATPLYDKKAQHVISPVSSPRRDQQGFPVESEFNTPPYNDDPVHTYASDAGYIRGAQACDTLSDFHCMSASASAPSPAPAPASESELASASPARDTKKNILLPALPEATPYSHSNFNHSTNGAMHHNFSPVRSTSGTRHQQEYYPDETSSLISSMGHSSTTNTSTGQTACSDGALKASAPFTKEDPPVSIQFRHKQSKRYSAYQRQKRAKATWKKSHENKNVEGKEKHAQFNACSSEEKYVAISPSTSARKVRRDARKREQPSAPVTNLLEEKMEVANIEQMHAAGENAAEEKDDTANSVVTTVNTGAEKSEDERLRMAADPVEEIPERRTRINEERIVMRQMRAAAASGVDGKEIPETGIRTGDESTGRRQRRVAAISYVDGKQIRKTDNIKTFRRSHWEHRALSSYQPRGEKLHTDESEINDSRNEVESARDSTKNGFSLIMDKWKNIEQQQR